ncbi:MAG: hypothetical protein ABR572_13485, partial [Cryomorphaceae bacterium]
FYTYKATENGFLLFAPRRWWTVRYTGEIPLQRALAILDVLDLYLPYFLTTGVVAAATITYIPDAFQGTHPQATAAEQLMRLSITTALSAIGVGFT